MNKEIKSGDVVKLKSGSPDMVITINETSDRRCLCQWSEGSVVQEGFFDKSALIKVEGK